MSVSSDLLTLGAAGLAYTYAGYPALLALLARAWPLPDPRTGDEVPAVSVVVACAGDAALLPSRVEDLLAQSYPGLEVLVVLDGVLPDPGLAGELARLGPMVRAIQLPSPAGKTVAQNRGAEEARGDVLVFTDVGCRFAPGAIAELVAPLTDPAVAAVCGELAYSGTGPEALYWRYECALKRLESRFSGVLGANGPIYAVRRAQYVPLPPGALSDLVEPLAIVFLHGGRVVYRPEARALEPLPAGPAPVWRAKRRIALRALSAIPLLMPALDAFRRPRLALAYASHKLLRWLSFVFAGALVAGAALSGLAGLAGVALIAALALAGWLAPGRRATDLTAYAGMLFCAQLVAAIDFARGIRVTYWTPTNAPRG